MATHSSVFAWRIPGMGEPGGLSSMGSHRVGHDWSNLAAVVYTHTHTVKYNPAIRKNEILPIVAMWMDLEGIMLS